MKITKPNFMTNFHVVSLSRSTRIYSLIVISAAMMVITANFFLADAIFERASVLPFYIMFFVLMYVVCMLVEYASLWCERGYNFHCTRVMVHSLALVLVTYEMGTFYGSDKDVYSHLPTYSITSALSQIVVVPSAMNNSGI